MGYPAATMSCHVSNPKESLASLDYRYKVAVGGMLGYELNILKMSDEIKAEMAKQIAEYKTYEHVIRLGDYYNLAFPTKYPYSAYYYATSDATEILLTVIERYQCPKGQTKRLKIKAANPNAAYVDARTGKQYSGAALKEGIVIDLTGEPMSAHLFHLKAL
jgi:alpha-galactosidase